MDFCCALWEGLVAARGGLFPLLGMEGTISTWLVGSGFTGTDGALLLLLSSSLSSELDGSGVALKRYSPTRELELKALPSS